MRTTVAIATEGLVPSVLVRNLPRFLRAGYKAAAEHWHAVFRPLHFTNAAYFRYGVMKRDARYTRKKQRKFGHSLPLVWSGDSRDRTAKDFRITSSTRGARVMMRAPRLNLRGAWQKVSNDATTVVKWRGPREGLVMRDELTRVNRQEQKVLAGVVVKGLVAESERFGAAKAIKQIKGAKARFGSKRMR